MPRMLKVAVVQMDATPALTESRLARAQKLIAEAARDGAQLVVLPEVFNTGYGYSDANFDRAEALTGPTVTWMKQVAKLYDVYVAGSLLLLDAEDIYNSLLLVSPDGGIWRYDKLHPWVWERAYFRQGERITVADTPLGKFGLLVCWDHAYSELWARYAGQVDAMIVVSSPPTAHDMTFVFPGGATLSTEAAGAVPRYTKRTSAGVFGAKLRAQATALGVPVFQTTACGQFDSELPLPRLSLMLYALGRVDLWGKILCSARIRVRMPFYQETWVADAQGRVLAQVPPEVEGVAVAEVTLSDTLAQPEGTQPKYGLSAFAYGFTELANVILAPVYRAKLREKLGLHGALPKRGAKAWAAALVLVGLLALFLGRRSRRT